jgi:hypothetical protein
MNQLASGIVADIEVFHFVRILGLAAVYAVILALVIGRFSNLIGDRRRYMVILPILMPTMVLIISVIKSSLALSLGLVGALSIVRFRTPIKEPEELTYLFVAIAVGLGLGADQVLVTSICFAFLVVLLAGLGTYGSSRRLEGVFIDVESPASGSTSELVRHAEVFKHHRVAFDLRRFEEDDSTASATYYVEARGLKELEPILARLRGDATGTRVHVVNRAHS